MRIQNVAAASVLGLALAFSGCAAGTSSAPPAPPAEPLPQADVSTPEPEPVPVAEPGSIDDPLPVGYVATMLNNGQEVYEVSVRLVDGNATKAIADANMFNDPPPAGMKYVLVEFTFTALSDTPVMPGVESFSYQVATPDGKVWKSATVVVPGEGLSGAPDLYKGQTFTGNEAYVVPEDADTLFITAVGQYFSL